MAAEGSQVASLTDWPGFGRLLAEVTRRARPSTPIFLPVESQWTEEPGSPESIGHKESDITEANYDACMHS